MREYIIMTDSCADLSDAEVQELGIVVVPLHYELDGVNYTNYPDHSELEPAEFFARVSAGAVCKTAAVSVGAFVDEMTPILQEGKDILYIAFSGALSTTYQSACIAAGSMKEEFPEATVHVLDTTCASLGQGLLVYLCACKKMDGLNLDEVLVYAKETAPSIAHWVTVDDLFHLKRGGRVSAATAVVGSMLSIKPIIHVDDEGRLINVGKARGRKASLLTLADEFEKRVKDPSLPVFISHGDCEEDARFVAAEVEKRTGAKTMVINYVGPVIGAHTGAGVIALCFAAKER